MAHAFGKVLLSTQLATEYGLRAALNLYSATPHAYDKNVSRNAIFGYAEQEGRRLRTVGYLRSWIVRLRLLQLILASSVMGAVRWLIR